MQDPLLAFKPPAPDRYRGPALPAWLRPGIHCENQVRWTHSRSASRGLVHSRSDSPKDTLTPQHCGQFLRLRGSWTFSPVFSPKLRNPELHRVALAVHGSQESGRPCTQRGSLAVAPHTPLQGRIPSCCFLPVQPPRPGRHPSGPLLLRSQFSTTRSLGDL